MSFEIDKEKIRQKLEQLKNPRASQKSGENDGIWRPDPAKESIIRLIQYPHSEDPFFDIWYHYNVGGRKGGIMCLERNFEKECPVCELGRKLSKSAVPEDKELAKKMFPKQRFFAAMIDRASSSPTVKFWGFGKEIYTELLNNLIDNDFSNYLDPVQGLDAVVTVAKVEGKTFGSPKFKLKRKESRLAETDEQIKNIIQSIPKYENIFKPMNSVQVQKILDNWLAFGEDKDDSLGVVKASEQKTEKNNEQSNTNVEDVDKAFQDALDSI